MNKSVFRYLIVVLFVAIYIIIGYLLKPSPSAYVLIGIPLTLCFQFLIVKQPIHKLWLRDEEKFQFNKKAWLISACFLVFPIYKVVEDVLRDKLSFLNICTNAAIILGAFAAGYCYSKLTRKSMKDLFLCLVFVGILRSVFYFFPFLFGQQELHPDYSQGLKSLLTYIPIAFVVEEVVFRGILDTYIEPTQKTNRLWSALFISCLWGLWHLPLSNSQSSIWFVALMSMLISLWGIFLSIFWRRSGNLAVPGLSHAFADAVRDALSK